MGASRFIASKLSDGGGRLSHTSNTIAWVSVCLSVAIMIVAIAVVAGFKREIRARATGFMGSVMLVQPGQAPVNEHYPFSEKLSYRERVEALPGVESFSGVAWRSGLIKTENDIEGLYFKGVDSLYDFSFFGQCLVDGVLPDYHGRISMADTSSADQPLRRCTWRRSATAIRVSISSRPASYRPDRRNLRTFTSSPMK